MTMIFKQYIRPHERGAFEAAGWKVETELGHPMMTESLLVTREMDESGKRISMTTANRLPNGEIEIIARVDTKEQIFVIARHVAASLIENVSRALSEV